MIVGIVELLAPHGLGIDLARVIAVLVVAAALTVFGLLLPARATQTSGSRRDNPAPHRSPQMNTLN